jgi:hypothetical protein
MEKITQNKLRNALLKELLVKTKLDSKAENVSLNNNTVFKIKSEIRLNKFTNSFFGLDNKWDWAFRDVATNPGWTDPSPEFLKSFQFEVNKLHSKVLFEIERMSLNK